MITTGPPGLTQNYSNVPGSNLKWHEVLVYENVFKDCMKHLVVENPINLDDHAKSHIAPAVTDHLRRWQCEILEHPPYSSDKSPCDYDLAKVKEPLRGTRYNTRDELIRDIVRSIRCIKKHGRDDGVRRLPNIWQRVISKGATIMKVGESWTKQGALDLIGCTEPTKWLMFFISLLWCS